MIISQPTLIELTIPSIRLDPPTLFDLHTVGNAIAAEDINRNWINDAMSRLHPIDKSLLYLSIEFCDKNYDAIVSTMEKLSKHLISKLYDYLKVKIPLHRSDLMLNRYWV